MPVRVVPLGPVVVVLVLLIADSGAAFFRWRYLVNVMKYSSLN